MTSGKHIISFSFLIGFSALFLIGTNQSAKANYAFDCIYTDNASTEKTLQTLLDQCVANFDSPGAVLLIQTPALSWIGASGTSNTALQIPMQPTDVFRIGSMTKMFVAATILKLSEEEKIDLDAQIKNYLPQTITTKITNSSQITVRQLLNMTSGIYNYTDSQAYGDDLDENPYRSAWSAEELLAYAYGEEADFLPGTGWAYSNTNYILLDLIVAQISGTSLATEMRRLVFTPLGMQNTFMEIIEPRDVGFGGLLVRGYDYGEDITQINDALGFGDGGLISNAQDLATFLSAMFLEKSLLSKNSLIQMLKFDPIGNYGLGISLTETDFGISWEHSGSTAGFMGDMIYLPDEQTIFVLLTNDFNSELKEPVFNASLQIVLD